MLAGQTTATFDVAAVADGIFDSAATVNITATAAGYDPGNVSLSVTNVDTPTTTVVVNKFMNGPDLVELLVIAGGAPNTTTNMQGMVIKDYSVNIEKDTGGSYTFNSVPLFESLKAGTLITLSTATTSSDVDASDFTLTLGLGDTTLFTPGSGTFDISQVEMVSIKAAGSGASGTTGAIHSLAAGLVGATTYVQYTDAPPPKAIGSVASPAIPLPTGFGVMINNYTSTLTDFNGTDATAAVAMTAANFGVGNNFTNTAYIRSLRGYTNLDAAGLATIVNGTSASPYLNKNIFGRNLTDQTVAISVIADAAPGVIAGLRITVPAGFGAPLLANVTVTGAGPENSDC